MCASARLLGRGKLRKRRYGALADVNNTRETRKRMRTAQEIKTHHHNASTYVLHRCGGCRWMPPLERLLNASRAANGVDDASAADALAAVWETRVLFTGKL